MRIDSAFEVPVPIDAVWAALLDIERIAPCLPGASIDENRGDGEFGGSMRIKLGPVTSTFEGKLKIAETDDAAHRSVIEASAKDTRGQGAAAATITSTLERSGDGTRVAVRTDMKLAGTAAQFGRGVVNDVSEKLMAEFATRLADEIENPAAPTAASAAADERDAPSADPQGSTVPPPRPRPTRDPEDDVLDLTAVGRDALLKRAAPVVAGVAVLALVALARRGGGGGRRGATIVIEGPVYVMQAPSSRSRKESDS